MGKARFEASESEEMRKITPTSAALDEKTSNAALLKSLKFQTRSLIIGRARERERRGVRPGPAVEETGATGCVADVRDGVGVENVKREETRTDAT